MAQNYLLHCICIESMAMASVLILAFGSVLGAHGEAWS